MISSGVMPSSSRRLRHPAWYAPRDAPPARMNAVLPATIAQSSLPRRGGSDCCLGLERVPPEAIGGRERLGDAPAVHLLRRWPPSARGRRRPRIVLRGDALSREAADDLAPDDRRFRSRLREAAPDLRRDRLRPQLRPDLANSAGGCRGGRGGVAGGGGARGGAAAGGGGEAGGGGAAGPAPPPRRPPRSLWRERRA